MTQISSRVPTWNHQALFSHPDGGDVASGALLALTVHCKTDSFVRVGTASAQVFKGSTDMIMRLSTSGGPDTVLDGAIPAAQEALDVLAVSGGPFAVLDLSPEIDLIWWLDSCKAIARLTVHHGIQSSMRANPSVIDAAGNEVVQPSPPPVRHHESFRYFRLSQATDDLFDAFRNAYLALESVLADITPKSRETEKDWLLQALANAEDIASLASLLSCPPSKFPDRFHDDIYKPVRCPLSHAKDLGLDPASSSDRDSVLKAYKVVVACFLLLAEKQYGLHRRGGGGMTSYGLSAALSPLVDAWSVCAGSDSGHGRQSLVELPRVAAPAELNRIRAKGAAVSPFDPALGTVNFIAAFDMEELAFSAALDGELDTSDLYQLEVVLDFWNRYDLGYRTLFRA